MWSGKRDSSLKSKRRGKIPLWKENNFLFSFHRGRKELKIQYPEADKEHTQPIVIKLERDDKIASSDLALMIINTILKAAPYTWWSENPLKKERFIFRTLSDKGKKELLSMMKEHHGEIIVPETPLMIKVRKKRITINRHYWWEWQIKKWGHNKDPDAMDDPMFLRPILVVLINKINEESRENATLQEVKETTIQLIKQARVSVTKNLILEEKQVMEEEPVLEEGPATPDEIRQLTQELAIAASKQ